MPLPRIPSYLLSEVDTSLNSTSWSFEPRRAALLVHDLQNHFVDVFERRPDAQITRAVDRVAHLATASRAAAVPVFYTAQPPAQDPADRGLLTDFWGPGLASAEAAKILSEVAPVRDDTVLTKWRYSAFHRSDLLKRLRDDGRDQLVITGVYSHIGCLTTALIAFMHGIEVFFAADAQADFSLAEHLMAIEYVAGRCGQVCTSRELLAILSEPDEVRPAGIIKAQG